MKTEDDTVLFDIEGGTGVVTLNRPKALNALTHPMVLRIDEALTAWAQDPAVHQVLIRGAGERGLCAGGDIRAIHDDAKAGRHRRPWTSGATSTGSTPVSPATPSRTSR